jgi:hypothetical protein
MADKSFADYIPGIAGTVIGGIQSLIGGGQAHRAQKEMEQMVKTYKPNQGIMDYYNKALQRYNVNPYTSQYYNQAQNQIKAGTAQGLANLQDRRSALAGLPSLIQGQNDALLKAGANAEGQQAQALGQLGQASQVKAQEEFKPFEMKYNLLSSKAGGGNQIMNAGLSNVFGSLNNMSQMSQLRKMYGSDNSGSVSDNSGGAYDPTSSPYWKQRTRQ